MADKTVRVAMLTTSFPLRPDSVSGVFVQRLVKNLPSTVSVTVITPSDTSPTTCSGSYKLHCFRYAPWKWQLLAHQPGGIPVAVKNSVAMRSLLPIFIGAMFVACFRVARKVDIIHANWSVNGAIAGVVGFLLNKPVITTLRGEDVTKAKTSILFRYLLTVCLRSNSKLVVVSESIYNLLLHQFPKYSQKITFSPNGVDENFLDIPILENKVKKNDIFNLLTVASLIPRKGVETIIMALSYLDAPQCYKLSIVGNGPELENLKNLVEKKNLHNVVKFEGQVSSGEIVRYFRDTDAFILSSFSEGRPNVVLESFAAGIPVIASDIDGNKELVFDEENGLIFKSGDAQALGAKIEKLKKNQALQIQFSKRGREFILKNNLLWEHVGQKYSQIYTEQIKKQDSTCVG